jgi:benzoyl-CoA 2,3-dioxygenase component B
MLTEEAHHMFVGESGVGRIIQRTCELMNEYKTYDVREYGGIDLPTLQKYLNFHFSVSTDLFGQEISTNAATYYNTSLKGRLDEAKIKDDHLLHDASYPVFELSEDKIVKNEFPALNAINERLRDDYIADCDLGIRRWNKIIEDSGHDFRFLLPHRAFNRNIGHFSNINTDPEGRIISKEEWENRCDEWLPSESDQSFVQSLMKPVTEPGKIAGWIAPPKGRINRQSFEFEYVRFN